MQFMGGERLVNLVIFRSLSIWPANCGGRGRITVAGITGCGREPVGVGMANQAVGLARISKVVNSYTRGRSMTYLADTLAIGTHETE